jgi:acetyl/propionyl-CoA carboxylase alpha subunit
VEVCVKEGQQVKAGDILIVFKAMKMNNNIRAAKDGKVLKIDVKEGDNVPNHTVMIEME